MVAPILLLLLSLAGLSLSIWVHGPVLSDPALLAALCTLAALLLVLRARLRPRPRYIVVDGSNVLHWRDETPSLETVRDVVAQLTAKGFVPVIWFDANVGYKVGDRYLGPARLARKLGVPARQVFVAPKGTPADPLLLEGAEALRAKVVTNDRFRDWTAQHPQIGEPGFLVPGRVRQGEIVVDTGA